MARSLRILCLALVSVVAVGVAMPPSVQAVEMDKKAKADAKEAMRFYKEGNYEDAAKVFLKLSIAYPDMLVFVRNLGACYYYMRRYEPALSNLRDYVHRKKDIAADDRAEVEGWIGEMERLRDQASAPVAPAAPAAPVAPAPSPPVPAPAPEPSVASPEPPAPASPGVAAPQPAYPQAQYPYPAAQPAPAEGYPYPPQQGYPPGYQTGAYPNAGYPAAGVATPAPAPQPQPSSGGARKTVAWILGAVGVGSAVAGAYCTAMALDRFSKVEKKYDPAVEKEGNNFAKAQWVGYGLGAGLITAAIIVGASGSSSSSVALAPAVGPNGAGAVVAGSF